MCPIFLNLQDLSGLVRLTILYPKVQPQPSILCPKCFCESRVVFARALGVGFFLGRSCFHGWRLGKATKIRVGNPSFPGFLRFILCILYNIKLIWTPHKESKNFSGSRHLSTPTFGLLSFGQQAFFFRHLRPLSRLGLSITKTLYYKSNKRPGVFGNSKTPFVPTAPFSNTFIFPNAERKEIYIEIYPKLCAVASSGLLDLLLLSITSSSENFS